MAAVLDDRFSAALARLALGLTESELLLHLQALETAFLLHNEQIVHDLILEAVLDGMSQAQRAEMHALALKALQHTDAPAALLLFHASAAQQQGAIRELTQQAAAEAKALFVPIPDIAAPSSGA